MSAQDEFVVTKLDRLGRPIPDLYAIPCDTEGRGGRWHSSVRLTIVF